MLENFEINSCQAQTNGVIVIGRVKELSFSDHFEGD